MDMSKYRVIIAALLLTGLALSGYAQVNREELQDLPPVSFINYEGPHTRVDTREEIRQIGVVLGQQVSFRESGNAAILAPMTLEERTAYSYVFNTGALNRYFVTHSVSGPEEDKIDADIMGLGVDVAVDHIRNLRVIIQGYLQAAYSYSAADALLLAEFTTIYNAVYRGNWDYFTDRYKTPVTQQLIRERTGLSIRYDEWPGRTLIVIPLGSGRGIRSIDASVISDARVIEELRREDDQGIPQRQQIADLLERQAEDAEQQAEVIRGEIRQEAAQIAGERTQIAEERQQIQEERQAVQEQQQQGAITQQEAADTVQQLEERQQAVEQREEAVAQREDAVEELRETVQALEREAEEIAQAAQEVREGIREDQQAAIENPAQITPVVQDITGGVYGVSIDRTSPVITGQIIRFNPADGRQLNRSTWDTIHTRTVTIIGGRIFAVAGQSAQAVRLVEFNPTSLEMIRQSNDEIREGSLIWVVGSDLYAITADSGSNYLGRFNTNLELQARSVIRVHPDASVAVNQGRLLTQRENGSPMALNPADLTLIW